MVYLVFLGFFVSFLGQLPLGNMSFTATQVCLQEGLRSAWRFSIGVAIVEMLYLRLALTGMDWIVRHRLWFVALGWVTVVMFLVLGILSFVAARKQTGGKKALVLNNTVNRFALGLMMSALNPVQIPFWFLWTSTFIQTKLLPVDDFSYSLFTIGAGAGTIGGLAVYMYGGNWLVSKMNTSTQTLNKVMGIIFLVTALIQLWRMLFRPWI
ncbi:LysE family transporter [Sediminibacterium soli]|uniref:LysE family transporter n=1 Tax=Sediminibacterium soli TaxID=2698829 RepID=UPI0013798863|nr:LysE family transporter [Sediminibacterium soli]NCI46948.1 LysE family transporter [Sediminibacterium soli]